MDASEETHSAHMIDVLNRLLNAGYALPLSVAYIGHNGSISGGRYDAIDAIGKGDGTMATRNTSVSPPRDALALLRAEHHEITQLFQKQARTKSRKIKRQLAAHVCAALEKHAQVEETIFYPVFAYAADDEGKVLVENALQEHQTVRDLMAELEETDEEAFDAQFCALRTHVDAHIQDEEQRMFPEAEALLAAYMDKLTAAMQQFRQQRVAS
jgi:hemerythrin-like domain-containing protein